MKKSIFNLNRAFGLPIFLFSFLLLVPVYLNIHEYLFDYQSDSLLHHDIGFLNSVFIIPIWIWALGEYSYHRKDNRFLLLLIEPIFILLAYFTNDYHQLLFDGVNTVDHVEMTRKVRGFGPLRLIHAIYTAVLWNVSSFWFCYKIYQKSSLKWIVPVSLL